MSLNKFIIAKFKESLIEKDGDLGVYAALTSGTNYQMSIRKIKEFFESEGEDCAVEKQIFEEIASRVKEDAVKAEKVDECVWGLPWLGLTKLTSEVLKEKFGEPLLNEEDEPDVFDWRYQYKIRVGSKLYNVYDKLNEDDTFDPEDDIEWFADGNGTVKHLEAGISAL